MNQQEFEQNLEKLTKQEERVLKRFLEGNDVEAIADDWHLTEVCIRSHLSKIYRKFLLTECPQRKDLTEWFIKYKPDWVSPSRRQELGMYEPEFPNGSVPLNSYFYIQRGKIETGCYQAIKNPGALIRIKAPKLMGKSSLISRILAEARKKEVIRIVEINLSEADEETLDNSKQFLRWFCKFVGEKLELENRLQELWKDNPDKRHGCLTYFERYLLPQINCPLIIVIDEIERIFTHTAAQDFLPILRLGHEKAKKSKIWGNLRLIVVQSTEVYVQIKSTESPFNVGLAIELPDFTPEQVNTLAIRHGLG